jgi:hypothetical protein
MKRIIAILLILAGYLCTYAQIYPTIAEQYGSSNIPEPEFYGSSTRSTPPGTLLYANPFINNLINGLSSESWAPSESAADFLLQAPADIAFIRWWFLINSNPATTDWIIRIYNNQNCLPSSLLGTWNISAASVNYEVIGSAFGLPLIDYWAALNPVFQAQAGQNYWVSIQAVITDSYRAYWLYCGNTVQDCPGVFRGSFFGYPSWVPSINVTGDINEFPIEIYGMEELPPVPISNWALFIGLGLIITFTVIRFRRIS